MNQSFAKLLGKYAQAPAEPVEADQVEPVQAAPAWTADRYFLELVSLARDWPEVFRLVVDESQPYAWLTYLPGSLSLMAYVERIYNGAHELLTNPGRVARLERVRREVEAEHGQAERVLPAEERPRVMSSTSGRGMKTDNSAGKSEPRGSLLAACRK